MAPQAQDSHRKTHNIPVALIVLLGLCLAYTLSYVIYRAIKARRRAVEQNTPATPNRTPSVCQFMNGDRILLNFNQPRNPNSASLPPNEEPDVPDEEKPLTDPSPILSTSPAETASASFTPLSVQLDQLQGQGQLKERGLTNDEESDPSPSTSQGPFSHRTSKVKFLSKDRAEAITHDPKLAPVQGPLRPLSMVPSPTRKKRTTLFGFGIKHTRSHGRDLNKDLEAM